MKTVLSLITALALGCASTAALAQQGPPPPDQQNGQPNGPAYDQGYSQGPQYDQQNDQRFNQNFNQNGYDQGYRSHMAVMAETTMVPIARGDVRMIQMRLRRAGYDPGRLDGHWGQQTASAVASFQRANGLLPTGNLNMGTIRTLGLMSGQGYGGYNNGRNFNNGPNNWNNGSGYNNQNGYQPDNGPNNGNNGPNNGPR